VFLAAVHINEEMYYSHTLISRLKVPIGAAGGCRRREGSRIKGWEVEKTKKGSRERERYSSKQGGLVSFEVEPQKCS
jgi:hypothetical protein